MPEPVHDGRVDGTDPDPVVIGRVHDPPAADGRVRVLVDRLWPRGLRKDGGAFDEWVTAVAPSTELRRWYGHDPERFAEFRRRYREELARPQLRDAVERLRGLARGGGGLVLLTATRDPALSHAAVLAEVLAEGPASGRR